MPGTICGTREPAIGTYVRAYSLRAARVLASLRTAPVDEAAARRTAAISLWLSTISTSIRKGNSEEGSIR
jgi:hypothetical protein